MHTFVSVIIPTFGGSNSLKRAIDSVLTQDYSFSEVIVVDDNNPDTEQRTTTENIMREYQRREQIKYVRHEKNKNGSAARNTGVQLSKGDYISFLDDDDIFLQGKLRKQATFLDEHIEYDATYCWRIQSGTIIGSHLTGDLSKELLDLTFTPCTPSLMIRRKAYIDVGGFDESYNRHQDFEFLLRFFKNHKIGVVKEPLIEIIGNNVDNHLKGKNAVELKKKFLDTFSDDISRLEREHTGYKKYVYAKHYVPLMIKLLRYGDLGLAVVTYFRSAYKGGMCFWKEFVIQIYFLVKKFLIKKCACELNDM